MNLVARRSFSSSRTAGPTTLLQRHAQSHSLRSSMVCQYRKPISTDTHKEKKEELVGPLGKHIRDMILATGPIPVAKYMQLALTSPIGGYYTRGQVFGREGDFVTSPEISQMFGEVVAVWYVLHWEALGRPAKTAFVELGPGRGTLISDMLRAAKRFPAFFASIQCVHLVERSPELRKMQHERLGCDPGATSFIEDKNGSDTPADSTSRTYDGIPVKWHDLLEEIDMESDHAPMVMAHEFFDALPVYKFEKGNGTQWSEILVDVADSSTQLSGAAAEGFKFVKARNVTASAAMLLRDAGFGARFSKGDRIEVAPEAARMMALVADWITARGGMGLAIDYGQDWTQGDTFRGIKDHRFAHPLSAPGSMDLTADVDFSYLRHAAAGKAKCHGPIEQGSFLHAMGIQARLQQLLQLTGDQTVQKNLVDCYKRLTDPYSMGRIYKVLAVLPNSITKVPIPFAQPSKDELNKPKVEKIVK